MVLKKQVEEPLFPPPLPHRRELSTALRCWLERDGFAEPTIQQALAACNETYLAHPDFEAIENLEWPDKDEITANGGIIPDWHWRHRFYRVIGRIMGWTDRKEDAFPLSVLNLLRTQVWPGKRPTRHLEENSERTKRDREELEAPIEGESELQGRNQIRESSEPAIKRVAVRVGSDPSLGKGRGLPEWMIHPTPPPPPASTSEEPEDRSESGDELEWSDIESYPPSEPKTKKSSNDF